MRGRHGHHVQQQARALAAGQVLHRGFLLVEVQAELGQLGAAAGLAGVGHGAADDLQRGVVGIHGLDLVLVEPADLDAAVAVHVTRLNGERARDHLGEGRLAGAVDAQEADTVVDVHVQVQARQDGRVVAIADGHIVELQQQVVRQRRFSLEDIKARSPQVTLPQRFHKIGLANQAPTRSVDQHRAWFHS